MVVSLQAFASIIWRGVLKRLPPFLARVPSKTPQRPLFALSEIPSNAGALEYSINRPPGISSPSYNSRGISLAISLEDHVLAVDSADSIDGQLLVRVVQNCVVLAVVAAHGPRRAGGEVPEADAIDVEVLGVGYALVEAHAALHFVSTREAC